MKVEDILWELLNSILEMEYSPIIIGILIFYIVVWILVLSWVWNDISERTESTAIKIISVIVVAILNVPGLLIYLLGRPRFTLEELFWSDLERRYLLYETADLDDCPSCGYQLRPGFVNCPSCGEQIKVQCDKCEVFINLEWEYCPYCGDIMKEEKEQHRKELANQENNEKKKEEVKSKPKTYKAPKVEREENASKPKLGKYAKKGVSSLSEGMDELGAILRRGFKKIFKRKEGKKDKAVDKSKADKSKQAEIKPKKVTASSNLGKSDNDKNSRKVNKAEKAVNTETKDNKEKNGDKNKDNIKKKNKKNK